MSNFVNLPQVSIRFFVAVLSLVLFSIIASAQTIDTATVKGTVLDQNKASIAGAKISVVNVSTGKHRETVYIDPDGSFSSSRKAAKRSTARRGRGRAYRF